MIMKDNFVNNRRHRIQKKKIKITITIDEDLYYRSADFIYNMSGFLNHSLKKYVEKCEREKEDLRIIDIMERAKKNGMSPNEWQQYQKDILSFDWVNDDDN